MEPIPQDESSERLNATEYINTFPMGRRNEIRRQLGFFKKKYGKYPRVRFGSLTVQIEDDMPVENKSASQINESSGICKDCMKGYHERCPQVLGTSASGPVFCTCYCTGGTSLGNILYKEPIPRKVKEEFKELPEYNEPDPLGQVFK